MSLDLLEVFVAFSLLGSGEYGWRPELFAVPRGGGVGASASVCGSAVAPRNEPPTIVTATIAEGRRG